MYSEECGCGGIDYPVSGDGSTDMNENVKNRLQKLANIKKSK